MAIRALLTNGKEIEVPSYSLDYAIANKKITAFLRSDGWVKVAEDKIRKSRPDRLCRLSHGDRDTDNLFIRPKD